MAVQVGVKEFRENLARWLERAAAGEEIVVTDRGKPKARLLGTQGETALERLVREGVVTLPTKPRGKLPPPIPV